MNTGEIDRAGMTSQQRANYISVYGPNAYLELVKKDLPKRSYGNPSIFEQVMLREQSEEAAHRRFAKERQAAVRAEAKEIKDAADRERRRLANLPLKDKLEERLETYSKPETFSLPNKPLDVKLVHYARNASKSVKTNTEEPLKEAKVFFDKHKEHFIGVGFIGGILLVAAIFIF